jgi:hypothetical protein
MSSIRLYDCLILRDGPGVLSVAQSLAPVCRTCALFSDLKFRNDGIHASHNILTHPAEFKKLAREQISSYHKTNFVDTKIIEAVNTTCKARTRFEVFNSKRSEIVRPDLSLRNRL